MRILQSLACAALAAVISVSAFAADLTTGLTQGQVSTITTLHNDEYSVIKATKITSSTVGNVSIDIPANTLATPKLFLIGTNTSSGGISITTYQAPNAASVTPDGTSTAYTDTISVTTSFGTGVTAAAPLTSSTLDTSTRRLEISATALGAAEVLDARVEYRIPAKYRWYRQLK